MARSTPSSTTPGSSSRSPPSTDVTEELFDRVIGVNLKGTFFGCKHALPALLRAGGGTIVNNSSVSAFANVGGNVSYASSKGAVMSLTRVLALEYADRNVRVNAICPGVIDTGMNRRNLDLADDPDTMRARWMSVTPLGRMGTPEEIARTVLYLASDQSSFTTGDRSPHRRRPGGHLMARLAGRVTLVTGAASGIGRAVARAFAAEGSGGPRRWTSRPARSLRLVESAPGRRSHRVIVVGRRHLGPRGRGALRWRSVLDASGRIDCLANIAGVISSEPVEEVSVAEWDRILGINLRGTFLCARAVVTGHEAGGVGVHHQRLEPGRRDGLRGDDRLLRLEVRGRGVEPRPRAGARSPRHRGQHGHPGDPDPHRDERDHLFARSSARSGRTPRSSRPPSSTSPSRVRTGSTTATSTPGSSPGSSKRTAAREGRPARPDRSATTSRSSRSSDPASTSSRRAPADGISGDALLPGAAAIVSRRVPVTGGHMDAAGPSLRLVQLCSARRDRADLEAARARGVEVALMPQRGCIAVAEQTLLLMLGLSKKVVRAHSATAGGAYRELGVEPIRTEERLHRFQWMQLPGIFELHGRTLGLVGFGEIATEVARRARAFGMDVVYWSRRPLPAAIEAEEGAWTGGSCRRSWRRATS